MADASPPLVDVRNLSRRVRARGAERRRGASEASRSTSRKGETVALVGKSGSGKTVSALSILRLLPYPPRRIPRGEIHFDGKDLLKAPKRSMRDIRGEKISIIFQEPMTSLNPLHTIEKQVGEIMKLHHGARRGARRARACSSCCARSASATPSSGSAPIRISSRAASASAS